MFTETTTKTFDIYPINPEDVDARTEKVRYEHPNTFGWFPTTQAWKFEGGDALVSLVGVGTCDAYTTLRLGDRVHSVPGSIADALAAFGFKSKVAC